MEPLLGVVLLGKGLVTDFMPHVVGLDEILNDSTGLPQCDSLVRIDDGWQVTIWVDSGEGRLLDLLKGDKDSFVLKSQGGKYDGYFPSVGTDLVRVQCDRLHHCR